jgi:hypothetical protein
MVDAARRTAVGGPTPGRRGPYNGAVIDVAHRNRVIDALWPAPAGAGTSTWAILDCARDDRIYPALRSSNLDYLCLYGGRLHPQVEAVAPHIVELSPSYRFTPTLIEMAWGQSWGVFVRTNDPTNLRKHLRTLLRVQDESGRILLFRYYDPRVLKVYLPTCQPDELPLFFGPVSTYLAEDEGGGAVIEFTFDGSELHDRRLPLTVDGGTPTSFS